MKKILLSLSIVVGLLTVVSCDKDYNSIGSDIIGNGHYEFDKFSVANINAYIKETGPVQTNNLSLNSLGVYTNPAFGETTSSFVTQLELSTVNPNFGELIDIQANDSVYLYVPYFSHLDEAGVGNQANTFILDSIHGDLASTIDLKIYENKYYISSFNTTDPSQNQKYFSDQKDIIEGPIGANSHLNTASDVSENAQFRFKNNEIIFYKRDSDGNFLNSDDEITYDVDSRVVKKRLAPGMWINLDKVFFKNLLANTPQSNLINNDAFKQYFKGLYFKATKNASESGALSKLNFSNGYIVVQYHSRPLDSEPDVEVTKKSYQFNLKGNTINFFDNNFSSNYQDALNNEGSVLESKLYLKGGNGSVAFVDLFRSDSPTDNQEIPLELQQMIDAGYLINDAILTFYIDRSAMSQEDIGNGLKVQEPERIYVYDAVSNDVILDYSSDSSVSLNPKFNKNIFGGIILREAIEGGRGIKYSVRLLEYIKKIMNDNVANSNKHFKLGVSVTESISEVQYATLKNATDDFSLVPVASVMNPLGTILYSPTSTETFVDSNNNEIPMKLKLEIYYTKPKPN